MPIRSPTHLPHPVPLPQMRTALARLSASGLRSSSLGRWSWPSTSGAGSSEGGPFLPCPCLLALHVHSGPCLEGIVHHLACPQCHATCPAPPPPGALPRSAYALAPPAHPSTHPSTHSSTHTPIHPSTHPTLLPHPTSPYLQGVLPGIGGQVHCLPLQVPSDDPARGGAWGQQQHRPWGRRDPAGSS